MMRLNESYILGLKPNFHLEPRHAKEEVLINEKTFIKFATNQLLVVSNLKGLKSSKTKILIYIIITIPHFNKCFFTGAKVNLEDQCFVLADEYYYLSDLFDRVKNMTFIVVISGSSAAFLNHL